MKDKKYAADIDSITKAQAIIKAYVHMTLVISFKTLNSIVGKTLFFKCECFQKGK
ncbi:putative ammonia-lyase, Serine racemase [Helianthus anomalus]